MKFWYDILATIPKIIGTKTQKEHQMEVDEFKRFGDLEISCFCGIKKLSDNSD